MRPPVKDQGRAMSGTPYDKEVAEELAWLVESVGGGDSVTGGLILGLLDDYETREGGPRKPAPPSPDVRLPKTPALAASAGEG
jgi:hypothetical protein